MFVVFEGIEGSGKDSIIRLLRNDLESKNKRFHILKYPNKNRGPGKAIYEFLEKNKKLDPISMSLLLLADFNLDQDLIKNEDLIIANRYFNSTLAYQTSLGVKEDFLLNIAKEIDLQIPDLVIYLDIYPEESIRRKKKDKKLDRFEKNIEFLRNVRNKYLNLIQRKVFAKEYIYVDAMQPLEEVYKDIKEIFKNKRIL